MKYKLYEVADVTMGQSPKSIFYNSIGHGIPFLQGNRTFGHLYPFFDTYTTNPIRIAKAGDIIMSIRAPVGDLNYTLVDMCLGRGVCSLRMKNGNQNFLFYLMKYYMPQIRSKESGTVFGSVNRNDISNLEIEIPKDNTAQYRISRYLAMLDYKIEINNKINHHLEQMAQAIFKSWFVDFEPTKPFTEIVQILGGGTPKTGTSEFWNGNVPFFTPKDANGIYVLETEKQITDDGLAHCNSRLFPINTVFVTARGTVGKLSLAGYQMSMNQSCYALIGQEGYGQYFVFHLAKHVIESLKHKASGAVFDAIVTRDFESEMVPDVTTDKANLFDKEVSPLYGTILNNSKENRRLAELRDTLLPRLMSGELSVADLEIED